MLLNHTQIIQIASDVIDNKGKSYTLKDKQGTYKIAAMLAYASETHEVMGECKKDFNLGQLAESIIKAVINGYDVGYYARANAKDHEDGRSEIEIKMTANNKDLATPLTQPIRTWFITPQGAYTISKKTLVEVFANPYAYMDYIKITNTGLRLKPKAIALGQPNKMVNEILGCNS